MRPLTLQIEGLRSFRGSCPPIDFRGRDYLAIIGDTGAGKSSLLEAMGWVLYGSTSWSGQPNQELMNDTSQELRVVLTFEIRAQRWRVTRALRRRADGSVGPARASLEQLAEDDVAGESVDGVRAVEARVQELIGLTHDGFTRAVVLPQGQFARLLVSDDPRDRAEILKELWGVTELTAAKTDIDEALADVSPMLLRVGEALGTEPDDPDAHLRQLQEEARRAADAAGHARTRVDRAGAAAQALQQHRAALAAATTVLTTVSMDEDWLRSAAAIVDRDRHLADRQEALAGRRQQVQAELDGIPDDDDGMSAREVAAGEGRLDRLPGLLRALRDARGAVRASRDRLADAERDAESARQASRQATDAARAHRDSRAPLVAAVDDAREAFTDARSGLARWREACERLDTARDIRVTAQAALEEAEQRRDGLRRVADRERTELARAREAKQRADRAHAAVAAAAGLRPGADCTVCHRTLPDGWTPPADADHAEAAAAAAVADERAAAADRAVAKAEADVDAAEIRVNDSERDVQQTQARARAAAATLAALLDHQPGIDEDDGVLLRPLRNVVDAAVEQLRVHEAAGEDLRGTAQRAGERVAAAQAVLEERRRDAEAAATTAKRSGVELRGLVDTIDARLAVVVTVPDDPLDGPGPEARGVQQARDQLAERAATLTDRAQRRSALQARVRTLSHEDTALNAARSAEVTRPLAHLARTLDGHCQLLKRAAVSLDTDEPELPGLVQLAPGEVVATTEAIATATAGMRRLAEMHRSEAEAALVDAEGQLHVLRQEAGLQEVDVHTLVATLTDRATSAAVDDRIATAAVRTFAERMSVVAALRAAHADLTAHEVVLRDLSEALNPGAFPKWLTMRRSHDLLVHASGLLEMMTADRYSFAEVDDPDTPWKVVDNETGLPRSPASLSGGETFVASLSLALGMVEMMARSGGRLESLWLDEGFGALDRGNLDAAVDALSRVAARGRMVAVISHVRAVAEQVEHVLAVTRSSRGSQARWLGAADRAALAEIDVGEATATMAAIGGLLD